MRCQSCRASSQNRELVEFPGLEMFKTSILAMWTKLTGCRLQELDTFACLDFMQKIGSGRSNELYYMRTSPSTWLREGIEASLRLNVNIFNLTPKWLARVTVMVDNAVILKIVAHMDS